MYRFDSIQQALNYVFDGYNVTTINLPNSSHPWFLVDQIRVAVGYNSDNNQFTRYMEHRDEYLAILNLQEIRGKFATVNLTVANFIANMDPKVRSLMIISLPGLFELFRHINAKTSPRVSDFWYWMNNTVLPTLYYNPQLVEQINELAMQRDEARSLSMMHHDELVDLKKRYNKQIDNNRIVANIALNPYDGEPHNIMDLFNAFYAKKIEICRITNPNPRGINGLLDK